MNHAHIDGRSWLCRHDVLHNAVTMTAFWPMIFWISSWTVHWGSLKLKFLTAIDDFLRSCWVHFIQRELPGASLSHTCQHYGWELHQENPLSGHEKEAWERNCTSCRHHDATTWDWVSCFFWGGHKCLLMHKIFHLHWIWRKHSQIKDCKALNSACVNYL